MLKMKKERFNELGLGCSLKDCLECEFFGDKINSLHYCSDDEITSIEEYEANNYIAPCVDIERIQDEATEEEYDAIRHNYFVVE